MPTDKIPWTAIRIAARQTLDIRQLRVNAKARGSQDVVALCDEVLDDRPPVWGSSPATA